MWTRASPARFLGNANDDSAVRACAWANPQTGTQIQIFLYDTNCEVMGEI